MSDPSEILETLLSQIQAQHIEIKINEFPKNINQTVVLDVEHDEQGIHVGTGILFVPDKYIYYFTSTKYLQRVLSISSKIIGHNIISDIEMLQFWGISVSKANIYWDTMLMGHILDSSKKAYGLKDSAKRELNIEYPSYDEIVGKHKGKTVKSPKCPRIKSDCCGRTTLDKQPLKLVSAYNALDVWSTYQLFNQQRKILNDTARSFIPL